MQTANAKQKIIFFKFNPFVTWHWQSVSWLEILTIQASAVVTCANCVTLDQCEAGIQKCFKSSQPNSMEKNDCTNREP